MSEGSDVFTFCSRKGEHLPFLCIGYGRRNRMYRMREAKEDRISEHKLTQQGELSTKPHWQQGCCLAFVLLSRLRAWDHRGKREVNFMRLNLCPVA